MNLRKTAVLSVVALMVGALGSSFAEARPGGHHRSSGGRALIYAAPLVAASIYASRYYARPSYYYPQTYYPPVYSYPPAYYYPPSPPMYIEQEPAPSYYVVPPQSQYQQPRYEQPQAQQPRYEQPRYEQPRVHPQNQPQSQNREETPVNAYYCEASRAYYPQVQTCSVGWQYVGPQARSN